MSSPDQPRLDRIASADVVVVGAGAAGCVVAARLSEDPDRRVCLVEAGPDYGPHADGRWPNELLDAADCAVTHDWGYEVDSCARVVGGCSSHNGCLVVWGTPDDYEEWASATGDDGWGWAAMEPRLRAAQEALGTRTFADDEIGAWTRAALAGWEHLGHRRFDDFNAPSAVEGYGLIPVNRRGRLRWGAAFAYLDPARGRANLAVLGDTLTDRVLIEDGRVRGVIVRRNGQEGLVEAPEVVLAASAYGSPAILLRSGVGPAAHLREHGIEVLVDLPAVGSNLYDHPCVHVRATLGGTLAAAMAEDDARGVLTHVQAKLKAASSVCTPGSFDLHLLPNAGWEHDAEGRLVGPHRISLITALLKPRSPGTVRLRGADPELRPLIDRNLFADPDGHDLAALVEGVGHARALIGAVGAQGLIGEETFPGAHLDAEGLAAALREHAFALYHPTGTCRLGRAGATDAVCDPDGRVQGVEGLRVADASVMPTVPRANTHLSVLAVADELARRASGVPAVA